MCNVDGIFNSEMQTELKSLNCLWIAETRKERSHVLHDNIVSVKTCLDDLLKKTERIGGMNE